MAKKPDDGEQLQLIETDHPEAKALKRLIGKYEGLVEERKAAKEKENGAREQVVEKVREIGTADPAGKIAISINGVTISIEPDEKVKIKHKGEDDLEGDDDTDIVLDGNESELSSRKKK